MTLIGVMAVTLPSLTLVNLRCEKRSVAEFMQESIVFLLRVQCRRKEISRSLSHLLMSFLSCFLDEFTSFLSTAATTPHEFIITGDLTYISTIPVTTSPLSFCLFYPLQSLFWFV